MQEGGLAEGGPTQTWPLAGGSSPPALTRHQNNMTVLPFMRRSIREGGGFRRGQLISQKDLMGHVFPYTHTNTHTQHTHTQVRVFLSLLKLVGLNYLITLKGNDIILCSS